MDKADVEPTTAPRGRALWAEDAITRFLEARHPTLRELDALEHVRILHNAHRSAVAGKPALLLDLCRSGEASKGGAASLSTADYHRVCIAAGVEGLARQGGFTQTVAATKVSVAFGKNGISVTEGSALQYFKRIRRRDANDDAREVFNKLTANAPRTLPDREIWLNQLAATAGRILGT
jgi:hypothetical protein